MGFSRGIFFFGFLYSERQRKRKKCVAKDFIEDCVNSKNYDVIIISYSQGVLVQKILYMLPYKKFKEWNYN